MTGVHARFPPQADIRPGVYAGLGGPSHVPTPLPPPEAAGGRGGEQRSHWPTRAQARAYYR